MQPMFGFSADIILVVLILIFSSVIHESAHALAAYLCGDRTAKDMGRISLNPMVHICPINSILLPAILFILSDGYFIIGGAKPVPIIPGKLKNPDRDMALTAAAGPLANLLLVVAATLLLLATKPLVPPRSAAHFLVNCIIINSILLFFNLLPIPPLDGSRIARYLFPQVRELFDTMDQWGLVILIFLLSFIPQLSDFVFQCVKFTLAGVRYLYHLW